MKKFEENRGKQKFPGPNFHGDFKSYVNKLDFSVKWVNIDIKAQTTKPGIYIRLCRPDNQVKEEEYFPFGQEIRAEEKYQELVKKIQGWDYIK